MRHLSSFKCNNDTWLDLAINSQKPTADQLGALSDLIKSSYANYELAMADNSKSLGVSSFGASKELLKGFYNAPPTALRCKIQERRSDHELTDCPYCGYPLSPDTLDHFIPKDTWPEFSIYSNNLVPQCRRCASIKGTRYFCPDEGVVMFIHPIYSRLLSKVGFLVNADIVNGRPSFECKFLVVTKLTIEEMASVKKHLEELRVKSRLQSYCLQEYRLWKNKISQKRFDIERAFRQRLEETPYTGAFSPDWNIAFLKGVLSCRPLIRHLEQFAPVTEVIS